MMIWDDMFEFYPEALEDLPRDVVMCSWHYDNNITDLPQGYFLAAVCYGIGK